MHIFSVLMTAQSVDKLSNEQEMKEALQWCRDSGIAKVYIESYRDRVFISQDLLEKVRDRFRSEGFLVEGCVTPTRFEKPSNGWDVVNCYTHEPNLAFMETIFRRTAAVFDVIMIDDFLFTDCTCAECTAAKGELSFGDYHAKIMLNISLNRILKPAQEVNPNVKIIIKYPLWYDTFHAKGYDTIRQSEAFDFIWAGNETREPDSDRWGRHPQTQGYYIMDWMTRLGKGKCMGGWYDSLDTTPPSYLEQARQTILGGARESMLFCYRHLVEDELGRADTLALREERPALLKLAEFISGKQPVGVSVPKEPDFDAPAEPYATSMIGMLGVPVIADIGLTDRGAVVLCAQASHFEGVAAYAKAMAAQKQPIVVTANFARLTGVDTTSMEVIDIPEERWGLLDMAPEKLDVLRNKLLKPLGVSFHAPAKVALHFYDQDMEVVQNFNASAVDVELDLFGRSAKERNIVLSLPGNTSVPIRQEGGRYFFTVPPRSLVVLQ